MAKKGERRSGEAQAAADNLVERLEPLGDVRARGMFGGFGIFHDGAMFGLVNSRGVVHLRVTPESEPEFIERAALRHGKMPYYTIPSEVLDDPATLVAWAKTASAGALAAKKGG